MRFSSSASTLSWTGCWAPRGSPTAQSRFAPGGRSGRSVERRVPIAARPSRDGSFPVTRTIELSVPLTGRPSWLRGEFDTPSDKNRPQPLVVQLDFRCSASHSSEPMAQVVLTGCGLRRSFDLQSANVKRRFTGSPDQLGSAHASRARSKITEMRRKWSFGYARSSRSRRRTIAVVTVGTSPAFWLL